MVSLPVFLKHDCDISVQHGIMGGFPNASLRGIYFQFVASQRRMLYYFSDATYDWVHHYDVVGEQLACGRFVVKVEDMTQCEHRAVHVIISMLRTINVPQTAQPEMVWKIYSTVRSLCRQVEDFSEVRIPVMVDIVRVFQEAVPNPYIVWAAPPPYPMFQEWRLHAPWDGDEDEDEDEDEDLEDAEDEDKPVPAARSSVVALEMVKLKPKETCTICLEGLIKATRMPCNHVFHERCIVRWLKRSNDCPLCRFQLPTNI